ncbi:MAG TPA: hypothetical protein VKE51_22325 [Vicinamibacterales bacterium]|nr:hypothetical protein [Vicinamibacterales bacterium]
MSETERAAHSSAIDSTSDAGSVPAFTRSLSAAALTLSTPADAAASVDRSAKKASGTM